jgi:hypothetical protein
MKKPLDFKGLIWLRFQLRKYSEDIKINDSNNNGVTNDHNYEDDENTGVRK